MRVLVCHNRYRIAGGEDAVAAREAALLAAHGHEVEFFSVDNDAIRGVLGALRTAWRAPYSAPMRERVLAAIRAFRPDVVHVHNFFPLLTPSVYDACADAGVAVVQTLHNYRTICPGALLWRNGGPCEECVGRSPCRAVLRRCYRGSLLATLAVARMVAVHRRRRTWETRVGRFIALTEFSKSRFVAGGLPAEKIAVKPNFVADPGAPTTKGASSGAALFVGRLSPEKGVGTLLRAWKHLDVPLRVAGEGALPPDRETVPPGAVTLLGRLSAPEVSREMSAAAFVVVPSVCYENFPLVVIEAFAHGLSVIASRLGALGEVVEDGVTGLHFRAGDAADLADKVRWATTHPDELGRMGRNARREYETRYTPGVNYRQLAAIYEEARGSGWGSVTRASEEAS